MVDVIEKTQDLVQHLRRNQGVGEYRLLLTIAEAHPAKFTNPEAIALGWVQRIARGEEIPFVAQYCRRALNTL